MSGQLPAFKPSGRGGMVDLKNIKVSEIISWGGYKSKFARQYKDVAGTSFVNGLEVFNDLNITWGVSLPDSPIYKFLITYGFTKEDLQELSDSIADDKYKIKEVILKYWAQVSVSEESFLLYLDKMFAYYSTLTNITISVHNRAYPETATDPELNAGGMSVKGNFLYSGIRWIATDNSGSTKPSPYTVSGLGIVPNFKVAQDTITVKLYRGGADVTGEFPALFGLLTAMFVGNTFSHLNPTLQTRVINTKAYGSNQYKEVVLTESYNPAQFNKDQLIAAKNLFYVRLGDVETCDEDKDMEKCDRMISRDNWTNLFWGVVNSMSEVDIELTTDGLFTTTNAALDPTNPQISTYMTVEALKTIKPEVFGFYVSEFMDLHIIKEQAGVIKRFFMGIIKAFLSLIDAITGIFLKIPVLKQMTEIILSVIGTMFGVDAEGARAILSKIIMAIIIIVISIYFPPASQMLGMMGATATVSSTLVGAGISQGVAAGLSTLVTYGSHAISIYNTAKDAAAAEIEKDTAEINKNNEYIRKKLVSANKVAEAFFGTMGDVDNYGDSNEIMMNVMFNPFYFHPQAVPAEEINQNITQGYTYGR